MSPYLTKTIMTALAAVALTAVSSPASAARICADNSVCWEVPDPPDPVDPPEPIYTPPVIDDPYPGDQGGDNGGDGGGGAPAPPPDAAACVNLQNTQPHGCTRALAEGGLQRPTSLLPEPWRDLRDMEMLPNLTRQFHTALNKAVDDLNRCYADALGDPELCENNFGNTVFGGEIARLGDWIDPWSFDGGSAEIVSALFGAPLARTGALWVGLLSPSVSKGGISINFGVIGASLASLNRFNDALYKARLQTSCMLWVTAWDQARCP